MAPSIPTIRRLVAALDQTDVVVYIELAASVPNRTGRLTFVDTNILLYAASTVPEEAPKAAAARAILDRTDLALSVQVLQEFYVQATRSSRSDPLSHEQAALLVESWLRFTIQEATILLLRAAANAAARYRIAYWDAAIIEAARMAGCHTVLSEDMADGRDFDGVLVRNPFRSAAAPA